MTRGTNLMLLNEHREQCGLPPLPAWDGTDAGLASELERVEGHAEYGNSAWDDAGRPVPAGE